jgi:ABC-type branched-subunit amino acid transport system ATPase component
MTERGLSVHDLTVRFGGATAVERFSFDAPTRRVTGLIGPNGAGKTTTFNACTGLLAPTAGSVRLDGADIRRLSSAARARRGLGRTFQQVELFDSLTVAENVAIGREGALAAANPIRHILGRSGDRAAVQEATAEALELCGMTALAGVRAGSLPTGHRRLVELARALAGRFHVLLLDEPSAGLDESESETFAAILQRVVAERDTGILLVEHDMGLVMDVCEHIYVLDFGKPLFSGTPAEVASSRIVRDAYLGAEIHDVA